PPRPDGRRSPSGAPALSGTRRRPPVPGRQPGRGQADGFAETSLPPILIRDDADPSLRLVSIAAQSRLFSGTCRQVVTVGSCCRAVRRVGPRTAAPRPRLPGTSDGARVAA